MPRLVCLDTQVLIWGIQKYASPGQEEMRDRADHLLMQLAKEKAHILIPSIALSEFLIGIPEDDRESITQMMSRGFQIVPYDTPAALQFARIWHTNAVLSVKNELIEGKRLSRHELKADICILAIASARRAECIYSADRKHMQRFAQGLIPVHDLRTMNLLGPLFDLPAEPTPD